MQLSYSTPIWLYPKPVDFRNQIDGLVVLIAAQLSLTPTSGALFIFRNRQANKIKLLWYDNNGFWLCYKRLETGRLHFPSEAACVMELTRAQMDWLLTGLDFTKQPISPRGKATLFY